MWRNPDTAVDGLKVYFNVYFAVEGLSVNPNVGAAESRVITPNFQQAVGYLGVWKDCNLDGYIGSAESALSEYPVALLDPSVINGDTPCIDGSVFNRDGWVYEFIWIGARRNSFDPSQMPLRMIDDVDARVWGDLGLPGESFGSSCFVNPPTGTFSSTGAMVGFVDCFTGRAIAAATMLVDETAGTSIGFGDNPNDPACSMSPLNVGVQLWESDPSCPSGNPGLLGHEEDNSRPIAMVTDCEKPLVEEQKVQDGSGEQTRVEVPDPRDDTPIGVNVTDEEGTLVAVGPVPSVSPDFDEGGSLYDSVNDTSADASGCDPEAGALFHVTPESDVTTNENVHRNPDFTLQFGANDGFGIGYGFGKIFTDIGLGEDGATDALLQALIGDAPRHGGIGAIQSIQGIMLAPGWFSTTASTTGAFLIRTDTLSGADPTYATFYASVGAATTGFGAVTPPGTGVYGFEWCKGATSGVHNTFDCEAAHWWDEGKGASGMETELWSGEPIGITVGQVYQLRDIDCYDGTLVSTFPGIGLGLTTLSAEGPCGTSA